jgi:8-amino-7-oxononanoate synthase
MQGEHGAGDGGDRSPFGPESTAGTALLDTPDSLEQTLAAELERLTRAGLRRVLHRVQQRRGCHVIVDGRRAIDFSSNDYLGLASDPRLAAAGASVLATEATGAAGARLISGNHPLHEALEHDLARFKHVDAALLFGSGYLANLAAIPALVERGDAIYADALNHASLIDACRLSRAEIRIIAHADPDALEHALSADGSHFRRRLVVTDGVFSMDGDRAPLDRIVAVARRHGAWTYVDDAHGTGVLGAHGRGSAEQSGVESEIDVMMGTLGKAFGVAGAFIAGSRTLVEYLLNRGRAFVFTTAPPPALAAAASAALRIARTEPWRRERVRAVARRIRAGLATFGRPAPGDADGHIIPVPLPDAETTMHVGATLRDRGFLVGAVRPPTVPSGTSRLRITASTAHSDTDVESLLDALREVLPPW